MRSQHEGIMNVAEAEFLILDTTRLVLPLQKRTGNQRLTEKGEREAEEGNYIKVTKFRLI